jgi:hypothetical protein
MGGAIGLMFDLLGEGAARALKAPWLLQKTSPPDALPLIGTERSMPRYRAEDDATYRRRLHDAWNAWLFAGTVEGEGDQGMKGQYAAAGYSVEILNNFEWDFENPKDTANWSRFVVVIEQPHQFLPAFTYGGGQAYGQLLTYGSTATAAEVSEIRSIARKWKEGHAINPWIYVILSHEYYGDPNLVYGAAGAVYGGETIRWAN